MYLLETYTSEQRSMASSHCPSLFHSFKTCSISYKKNHECLLISRRYLTSISLGATLLYKDFFCATNNASSIEFQLMTPGQSPEEAKTQIKLHARNILKIKTFIDSESWKEVQITLKESSPLLKQDLYTIIQTTPARERGELRRLYTDLFNNVTTLINAAEDKDENQVQECAEDKDENQVQECYDNIATDLNRIFARIL